MSRALTGLMELWPIRKHLTDSRMVPLVQVALGEVRQHRGQEVAAEWEDWQKSQALDGEN